MIFSRGKIISKKINSDLSVKDNNFSFKDVTVEINESGNVFITGLRTDIGYIYLEADYSGLENSIVLGDAWERGYSDLGWKNADFERIMPWYFAAVKDEKVYCFGVKTMPNSFCSWQCGNGKIALTIDVRNGSDDIILNGRYIEACTIVFREYNCDAFSALCDFCKIMCDAPRLPKEPVFGGNDWYCNYGDNSYSKIIKHTKRIVECSPKGSKPFMVIDDGWEICHHNKDGVYYNGGPWKSCNNNFKDMKKLAAEIESLGAIPGIWFRPLWTVEKVPDEFILKKDDIKAILDPSSDEVLEMIKSDVQTIREWGYRLIKHDFSTFDITGKWGFEMNTFGGETHFSDKTKTTAEIIKKLYSAIREAAGDDVLVMGCNTVSHLSAGIFELQRTGDDTSGIEWERTKKYGINSLAFRMPQHNNFYYADADCVGVTNNVAWDKNKLWLDILAKSGTALFVSIAEDAYSDDVKNDLIKAFDKAAVNTKISNPIDWLNTKLPQKWFSAFGEDEYEW